MAIDTIKFKRGNKNKLDKLSYGEPAYISDEGELYIGTESGVEKLTRNKEVEELSSQLAHIHNNTSAFVNIMQYKNLVTKNTDSSGEEFDDWTNAIQTAINENNRIELPAGTFGISKPIKIRDYKIIYGNGRKTQIVAKTGMNCVLDIDNYATSTSYTEIKNIFINGNSLADDGIRCVGFTNNSQISTMWVENCLESGVYITKAWYSKLEKMQIRYCRNGITAISTGHDPETQTNNINGMHFTDMYIAFIDNNGINFERDSGWSNMISNSTVEACGNHGIYINNIISAVTCMNIYMETIEKNGYQVDKGHCLNIIGGYVNVNTPESRCIQVGNINKLIVQGIVMACWYGDLEYMIYSLASLNDIHCIPLSNVTKRTIYYTGKFKGSIERIMSGEYGSDHEYDMSSLRTNKVEMTETVGYGKSINVELIKGSSLNSTVDASRIYQYIERTSISGGWGACKINLYGKVNDSSGTEKQVYEISNGYFIPTTMKFASYSTTDRPTSHETGMVIYDSTLKKPILWNGSNWTDFMGTIV